MSDSIYAPPEADIQTSDLESSEYYVVSPTKFFLLSIFTFSLYLIYWFYRNWRCIKVRDGDDSWPPMRALFYIFFTHSLFSDVEESIKTQERTYQWRPNLIAGLFVIMAISSNVLDRLSWKNIGSPTTDILSVLMVFLLPWVLVSGQRAINFASGDPEGKTNKKFSLANWAWLTIGGLWWLLSLIGIYAIVLDPSLLE